MQLQKKVYFQNLDGLRAIAAFAVIFAHLSYWIKFPDTEFYGLLKSLMSCNGLGGRFGVIFFFILSGFLITYLMFIEQEKYDKLNILHFYARRILRIWPLYFLTLIIGFIIYPMIFKEHHENASFLLYSLFAANFDHIYNGFPSTGILGVQWSVSVEEQFYLIWPIIFIAFIKTKKFPLIMILLIILSETYFYYFGSGLAGGDYHLLSCLKYLCFGGLIAYVSYFKNEYLINILGRINKSLIIVIYVVCFSFIFFQANLLENSRLFNFIYPIIPCLFFGFIIIEQNYSKNSFVKIGSFKILNSLGKISYGLYLTHMIAINIILYFSEKDSSEYAIIKALSSIALVIFISYLSYTFIEKYFLKLKTKVSGGN